MRKSVFLLSVLVTLFISCKKDKNKEQEKVDPREKFVGTWQGNYTFQIPNFPLPALPAFPLTLTISKSEMSESEIIIIFRDSATQNQQTTAVVSNNEYIYKPVTLNNSGILINLSGSGTIDKDGKTITESGNFNGSVPFQGVPVNLNGTWYSSLVKQ